MWQQDYTWAPLQNVVFRRLLDCRRLYGRFINLLNINSQKDRIFRIFHIQSDTTEHTGVVQRRANLWAATNNKHPSHKARVKDTKPFYSSSRYPCNSDAKYDLLTVQHMRERTRCEHWSMSPGVTVWVGLADTPATMGFLWNLRSKGEGTIVLCASCGLPLRGDRISATGWAGRQPDQYAQSWYFPSGDLLWGFPGGWM